MLKLKGREITLETVGQSLLPGDERSMPAHV